MIAATDLQIDDEFSGLQPPLADEVRIGLMASCVQFGIRDAVIYWVDENGVPLTVDGHHRKQIGDDNEIPYRIEELKLKTRQEVVLWILKNARNRRNLSEGELALLRGRILNLEKQPKGGDRKSKCHGDTLIGDTAERLAAEHGVSPSTIKRDAAFAAAVDSLPAEVVAPALQSKQPRKEVKKLLEKANNGANSVATKTKPKAKPVPAIRFEPKYLALKNSLRDVATQSGRPWHWCQTAFKELAEEKR